MEIVTPQPLEATDPALAELFKWYVNENVPEYKRQQVILQWKKEHAYDLCQCGSGKKAKFCECV
jgi:hypothetical protein